jgi:hypothetical protein
MSEDERELVIIELFDLLSESVFAEGCEHRIARSLSLKSDEDLIKLAERHGTYVPEPGGARKSQ